MTKIVGYSPSGPVAVLKAGPLWVAFGVNYIPFGFVLNNEANLSIEFQPTNVAVAYFSRADQATYRHGFVAFGFGDRFLNSIQPTNATFAELVEYVKGSALDRGLRDTYHHRFQNGLELELMPLTERQQDLLLENCGRRKITSKQALLVSFGDRQEEWEQVLGEPLTLGLRLRAADFIADALGDNSLDGLDDDDHDEEDDDEGSELVTTED